MYLITYPCWDLKLNHVSKWGPRSLDQVGCHVDYYFHFQIDVMLK